MPDIAIPIAFPDFAITVNATALGVPTAQIPRSVNVPVVGRVNTGLLRTYSTKVGGLGHAGILIVKANGLTKYYEYGRYRSAVGEVRKQALSDCRIGSDGHPTKSSLEQVIGQISAKSGQRGRVLGGYITTPGKFGTMLAYMQQRELQNSNSRRTPYNLLTNSCMHFAKWTVEKAGVSMPNGMTPQPSDWIEDVQDRYPDLVYSPSAGLTIAAIKGEESHVPAWATTKSWDQALWDGDTVTSRTSSTP